MSLMGKARGLRLARAPAANHSPTRALASRANLTSNEYATICEQRSDLEAGARLRDLFVVIVSFFRKKHLLSHDVRLQAIKPSKSGDVQDKLDMWWRRVDIASIPEIPQESRNAERCHLVEVSAERHMVERNTCLADRSFL